jgi:uncharacterized lipoprotein
MKRLIIGVLAVFAIAACSTPRDQASYRYGHDELTSLAVPMWNQGFGHDKEGACDQAFRVMAGIGAATKFVKGDVIAGCVDGIRA